MRKLILRMLGLAGLRELTESLNNEISDVNFKVGNMHRHLLAEMRRDLAHLKLNVEHNNSIISELTRISNRVEEVKTELDSAIQHLHLGTRMPYNQLKREVNDIAEYVAGFVADVETRMEEFRSEVVSQETSTIDSDNSKDSVEKLRNSTKSKLEVLRRDLINLESRVNLLEKLE